MAAMKCFEVIAAAQDTGLSVALTYDQRLLRRKKLTCATGEVFFVDLPHTQSVMAGQGFLLEDGRVVAVVAADEALLSVSGRTLLHYAWHIGNRHTPCEIASDRLIIQRDPVLKAMLAQLGADVSDIVAPFSPEGGAYGHGRTMGHDHGAPHDHAHDHAHTHDHSHD